MPDYTMEDDLEKVCKEETDTESEHTDEETPKCTSKMGRRCASAERLKEETRLVLLDFLGSLPTEKITARQLTQSESRPEILQEALRVVKSHSDASAYESNRMRFQKMAAPLRRKLSLNLKREIENFNPRVGLRRKTLARPTCQAQSNFSEEKKSKENRPAKLDLPPERPSSANELFITPSPVLSPEGRVAAMLDKIGQEVMETYPHLLDEPLEQTRNWNFENCTYEDFEKAARKVTLDSGLVGWSKVALLCYFAREITIEAPIELTDTDLVKLAEYTLRFIEETTGEWIETQGGWAGLELEEEILTAETLAIKYREQEDAVELERLKQEREHKRKSREGGAWNAWTKYSIAAVALGVGICYSLIRH